MPALTRAYLEWKYPVFSAQNEHVKEGRHIFQVEMFSTFTRSNHTDIVQRKDKFANVSLIREGYLGCTPTEPTLAISLDLLELFHRLKRRHPCLSVQAMVCALSDIHNVSVSF